MSMKECFKYIIYKKKTYLIGIIISLLIGIIVLMWGRSVESDSFVSTLLISIGTSIVAGVIVTFIDVLSKSFQDYMFVDINNIIDKAGISKIFFKRDLDEYDELIKGLSDSIDISGYSLRSFYQSYGDILIEKVSKNKKIKIRMLLVDPSTIFSQDMEELENGVPGDIYRSSINTMYQKFKGHTGIQIRTIKHSMGHMTYRIDDVMYVGPFFHEKSSKSTHTIKLKKGELFTSYQKDFDRMWDEAIEYVAVPEDRQ